MQDSAFGGSGVIAGGGYGGLTLPGGQQITLPGFGEGGAMGPVNTYAGTTGSGIKYYKTASGAITPQAGGGGMAAGGAIMGFSQYQSASQSGASTGTAVGSGVMTGIGGLGLMAGMAGAFSAGGLASGALPMLAGLGPVGWIAAGALLIGGMIMGNKHLNFVERTKETTKSITSKIDISNKELSWVNRNLVSLRQELSYIMQDSYYFREKDPTESFAADSQRGTI